MSIRAFLVMALLLTIPPAAAGHISVAPERAETGIETPFVVRIPNETGVEMTAARITFPAGIRVTGPLSAPAGWQVAPFPGDVGTFAGAQYSGSLPSGAQLEVTVVGTPLMPGSAAWRVAQDLADGREVLWSGAPDATSSGEPTDGEVGPAALITITGATLPPELEPGIGPPPEDPGASAPGLADAGADSAEVAGEGSEVRAWVLVVLGIVALLALAAAGWMWSNRPMDLPPDE